MDIDIQILSEYFLLISILKKTNENSVQVAWNENCPKHESYQGFLTSTGRFVGRREAAQIALHSGQIKELKFGSELYSEDLY